MRVATKNAKEVKTYKVFKIYYAEEKKILWLVKQLSLKTNKQTLETSKCAVR